MHIDTPTQDSGLGAQLEALRTTYRDALIAPRPAPQTTKRSYLVFALGTSLFGLPTDELIEVERPQRIVKVPNAPAHIAGSVVLGQEVLTVLDLHIIYKIPAGEAANQWLLALRPRETQTACLVDALLGIRKFDTNPDSRQETLLEGRPIMLLTRERIQEGNTS